MPEHSSSYPPKVMVTAIAVSLIVASMLNVYPLSHDLALLRPMFLMMVLLFWLIFQPRYVGTWVAFAVGLAADLILDTRLGQQAFAAVLMALTVKISSIYIRQLTTLKAWGLASLCLLVYQSTLWLLQYTIQGIFVVGSGASLLISMLTWVLVLLVLRRFV